MTVARKNDLYSQAFHQQSHQVFECMRRDDPVFQQLGITSEYPIWFVTRYAEVEQVLLNDKTFVRDPRLAMSAEEAGNFQDVRNPQVDAMVNNHMLNKEGEDHRRLRSLVSKAFTPRVIQNMRPRIQDIAGKLLDQMAPQGRMELIGQYAYPLPITVIAELLGIPIADRTRFRAWPNAVVAPALTPEKQLESLRLLQELVAYLQELVVARRLLLGKTCFPAWSTPKNRVID
jgi:cytochrome P450